MTREEAITYGRRVIDLGLNDETQAFCEMAIKALEQEPCEDKRLYIKVFADLEPDDIAEKIYQICDEDKFPKVVESLKEYFDFEPCEDCISRQAVLDIINFEDKWLFDAKSYNADTNIAFFTIKKKITEMPSVTPQQKVGKWTRIDKDKLKCSECEVIHCITQYPQSANINYCPNCGTKMESEGKMVKQEDVSDILNKINEALKNTKYSAQGYDNTGTWLQIIIDEEVKENENSNSNNCDM